MSAPKAKDAPKTPEEIRLEKIQDLRKENEKVITKALQLRGLLDNLVAGSVRDGQGNEYAIDTTAAEEMVSEKEAEIAGSRAKCEALKTEIKFKAKVAA